MDFQSVAPPQQYGAPQVFGQQGQQAGGQQDQLAAALQKAKQLLSSGQISADQYNQIASKFQPQTELATSAGNMGATTGQPMNILPGQGG